jgi:replicative DNA helicase
MMAKVTEAKANGQATANQTKTACGWSRIVATYDYTDERGQLLFQVVRYEPGFDGEPKTFRQRRPNGKDRWINGLGDVRRVLYRLPQLVDDSHDRLVFVVEGEKDADALAGLGLLATTNAMGAGKWRPEYNETLRDRYVIILPDNDKPGREHAIAVAKSVAGVAASVKIIELPDLPDKGDVSDWLVGGGTKQELLRLVQEAPAFQQTADPWPDDRRGDAYEGPSGHAGGPDSAKRADREPPGFVLDLTDSATFAAADYPLKWLIKRLLVEGQPAVIGGPRKSLKTSTLVDLALSLSAGVPFLGYFNVYETRRVALLSGESGQHTLQETARRVCLAKGIDLAAANILWGFSLPQLTNAVHLAELETGLRARDVEVLILDPVYLALLAGRGPGAPRAENIFDMGPLYLAVSQACLRAGATPILAHHTRRSAGGSGEPLDLDDLAYAGVAEFARQWLLLSRRAKFQPGTGCHQLWLNAGGSAGQGGLWSVDVNEGVIDEHFSGRIWEVAVSTATEANEGAAASRDQARSESRRRRDTEDDTALLTALDSLDRERAGASYNHVKAESRLPRDRMARAANRLQREGAIEEIPVSVIIGSGAKRECKGLRRRPF